MVITCLCIAEGKRKTLLDRLNADLRKRVNPCLIEANKLILGNVIGEGKMKNIILGIISVHLTYDCNNRIPTLLPISPR